MVQSTTRTNQEGEEFMAMGRSYGRFDRRPDYKSRMSGEVHVRYRFRKWRSAKHKAHKFGPCWYWSPWLERTFGLLQLRRDPSRLPHAKA
ncbi:MAG: hypothetical protein V1790_03500 [Planctomycetota bacterium]